MTSDHDKASRVETGSSVARWLNEKREDGPWSPDARF